MAFKTRKIEMFSYNSPQEMYQDNKMKNILGPLDYQTAMIDLYMENKHKKNIALELPTGSGKTLIGLLIGEFRRRKNKEKILFLCPTNQLVNQVVNQAREKYGINTIAFCGKQKYYNSKDKSNYLLANNIGVTTYSSFFAQNSFFEDVDIIIMDDVHSCEDYIISNWSIKIDKEINIFIQFAELLKSIISDIDYDHLISSDYSNGTIDDWCNLVPMPLLVDKIPDVNLMLSNIENKTSNYYAFNRIKENLMECNIYISNGLILIRPWIAPTLTFKPFNNAKQRICMSATLGKTGELERVTGIPNIFRLPIVNNWDKRGLGRKFFIFPDLAFDEEIHGDILLNLHNKINKSVVLTPNDKIKNKVINFLRSSQYHTNTYTAQDIEKSKKAFLDDHNAVVVLANRFDGIDFPDNESRMLFIINLPKTTNLQEKFLITRMGASKLYAERIQTRIVQSVGRCSRNASDYSIVCIMGNTIQNDLTKNEMLKMYPPELRAEIQFGLENSIEYEKLDDIMEQVNDFLERNKSWQEAEQYIVNLRNNYCKNENNINESLNEKLQKSSNIELEFQYLMWKKDYKKAYGKVQNIIAQLDAPSLKGYKRYWNYISGSIAYYLFINGSKEYRKPGIKDLNDAMEGNISVKWLSSLPSKLFKSEGINYREDYFEDIIIRLEKQLSRFITAKKLDKKIKEVLEKLNSAKGTIFENGHQEIGELLGYISINPSSSGAPDPYWIINPNICIVSEDKIYEKEKEIPISHVSEAVRHKIWIKENEKQISNNAEIITVLIVNSNKIDDNARIYAKGIYYLHKNDFIKWIVKASNILKTIYNTFVDIGDYEWRKATHKLFIDNKITPIDFLEFVKHKKLDNL